MLIESRSGILDEAKAAGVLLRCSECVYAVAQKYGAYGHIREFGPVATEEVRTSRGIRQLCWTHAEIARRESSAGVS